MTMVPKQATSVAIVVLTWRRYDLAAGCLESVAALNLPASTHCTTWLVDNASDSRALARVLTQFPQVRGLPQLRNLGYAAAMNRGIEAALAEGADFVFLLNNDARPAPDALETLLEAAQAHLRAGLIGPVLLAAEGDAQASRWARSNAGLIGPVLLAADGEGPEGSSRLVGRVEALGMSVDGWTGRIRQRGHGGWLEQEPGPVVGMDALSGAALLLRASTLREVGLFDPSYYLYFEDVDLCLRARAAGWGCLLVPRAVVHHQGSATIGRGALRSYYGVRNQLTLMARHGQRLPRPLARVRAALIIGYHLAQVLEGAAGPRVEGFKAVWQGARDHRLGLRGARPF